MNNENEHIYKYTSLFESNHPKTDTTLNDAYTERVFFGLTIRGTLVDFHAIKTFIRENTECQILYQKSSAAYLYIQKEYPTDAPRNH